MATRRQDSRPGRSSEKWEQRQVRRSSWSTRPTSASTTSSWSAPAWPARSAAASLAELGYNVEVLLLSRTARAARTASPPRAASTPPRTTRTTATASTGCSTTRSRAATSAPARPTSTAWPRSASTSSTSASPRACRSPASTAACSPTAPSAARRSRAPSTPAARPASSCCSAPTRRSRGRSALGSVKMYPAHRDARPGRRRRPAPRGIVVRDLVTGEIASHAGRRGGAGHRRLRQRLLPLDQRQGLQRRPPIWRAYKRGALFANPCFTQIHPTCIPVTGDYQSKLTLMSRVAAQRRPHLGAEEAKGDTRPPGQIPEAERDYYLERKYPSFGNLAPRDISSRAAKAGLRRGPRRRPERARRLPRLRRRHQAPRASRRSRERYGNLFDMYEQITGENPYKAPMRIYPAVALHDGRPVGGLQPDEQPSPACSCSARRTSPTTAPTGSAPAR